MTRPVTPMWSATPHERLPANRIINDDMRRRDSPQGSRDRPLLSSLLRCKNPVIFRATAHVLSMDKSGLRSRTLRRSNGCAGCPPGRGADRRMMRAADWCISASALGVPIRLRLRGLREVLAASISPGTPPHFRKEGSTPVSSRARRISSSGARCSRCGSARTDQENNILDVWFESGPATTSWQAADLPWPADVYSRATTSTAAGSTARSCRCRGKNASPYKTCITTDRPGRKAGDVEIRGNAVEPGRSSPRTEPRSSAMVAMLNYRKMLPRKGDPAAARRSYRKSGTRGVSCSATSTFFRTRTPYRRGHEPLTSGLQRSADVGSGPFKATMNSNTIPSSTRSTTFHGRSERLLSDVLKDAVLLRRELAPAVRPNASSGS